MSITDILKYGYFGYFFGDEGSSLTYMIYVGYFLCAVLSYLVGSVNFGIIVSNKLGKDIRSVGSKNAGTTNMLRTYGKKAAVITFIGDFLKSLFAQVIGRLILGYIGAYVAGLFCILGHAYPIFFKFKGGKGVVCMTALCMFTEPLVFLVLLAVFLIILFGFKMVSLSSVMTCLIYPMILFNFTKPGGLHVLIAILCSLLVIFLHRKNIVRIYNHEESTINIGKKKGNK